MPATEPRSTRLKRGKPLMTRRGRVIVLTATCFVAASLAFVPDRPALRPESPSPEMQPHPAMVQLVAPNMASPRPAVRRAPQNSRHAAPAMPRPLPVTSDMTVVGTSSAPRDDEGAIEPQSVVTINGCLEHDDERFQLTETAGDDAPKSRSWRSGFLRRSASKVDVVDHADRFHLPTYVGQRVSVTGTLVDREMQVRSVQIVALSCEENAA
jgi:hypothetical protein